MTSANDGPAASGTAPTATETVALSAAVAPRGTAARGAIAPANAAGPVPASAVAAAPDVAEPDVAEPDAPEPGTPPDGLEPEAPPDAPEAPEAVEDQTPFWMPRHPRWPSFPARSPRRRSPRRPAFGIFALVVLGLLATFFAWVSAEPIWLAVGHGDRGTATATQCSVEGAPYQCVIFTAAGGRYVTEDVTLLGTEHGHLRQGTRVPAEMVSRDSSRAYAVDAEGLRLRSAAGLVALLLCGLGIGWATGAARLEPPATRQRAFLACVSAPFLLALGFLAATW